ncbi:hypothetical protein P4641_03010 [Halalkalibacterium halodurans]|uniref:alpha/beta hydrolase n=1 Tax=Halalkalibacterium halodurans TaxID=86665 RepID=UPI002E1D209B|nr:hypothetical protein [Halalkalibacterium halodurans]
MKLLEIGLLVCTAIILYGYVFGYGTRWRNIVLSIIGVVVLLFHIFIEGLRIQSLLLYGIFGVCLVFVVISFVRKTREGERKKWKRVVAGGLGTIALAVTMAVPLYLLPIVTLPEPTGPYEIGVTNFHWVDPDREEVEGVNGNRELMVRIWYPAELTEGGLKAPYAFDPSYTELVSKELPYYYKALLYSVIQTETHSFANVPVADHGAPYPVLILSPGYGNSNFMYTSQAETLASHGYIVCSIEHTYYTGLPTLFPDGRIVYEQIDLEDGRDLDEEITVWVDDVQFVLDQLQKWNESDPQNLLNGRLDMDRVGMLGHSFGGATTAQVMHQDPRIRAGVNMDGFLFGSLIEEGLDYPFMYMSGVEEVSMEGPDGKKVEEAELPEEFREFIADDKRRKEGALKNNGLYVVIENAEHESFSDWMLYSPLLLDRDLPMLDQINKTLLDFFDEHLK